VVVMLMMLVMVEVLMMLVMIEVVGGDGSAVDDVGDGRGGGW